MTRRNNPNTTSFLYYILISKIDFNIRYINFFLIINNMNLYDYLNS